MADKVKQLSVREVLEDEFSGNATLMANVFEVSRTTLYRWLGSDIYQIRRFDTERRIEYEVTKSVGMATIILS